MTPFQYTVLIPLNISLKLQELRKPRRLSIFAFLFYLETNPFETGDAVKIDSRQREFYLKALDKYIVAYYTDHAQKEIRILSLKHIDEL